MNNCNFVGRLTKDVDLTFAQGTGTAIAKFGLAVDRRFKKEGQPTADFINMIAFGKTAEVIAEYIKKGNQIAVTTHVQTGSYDAKDGTKRYTTDFIVDSFDFISGAKQGNTNNVNNNVDNLGLEEVTPLDDGDMPF